MLLVAGFLALVGCKGKCDKFEAKMTDLGLGFSDVERERKKCNRGALSDDYIECALQAESRRDLADCGW